MKAIILLAILLFFINIIISPSAQAQCNNNQYDALVAIYNATDGANWSNTWDLSDCDYCNWYGVYCHPGGLVSRLSLEQNQLSGTIPVEIENLSELYDLNLLFNDLTGNIPPQIGNLIFLNFLGLGDNQLSGTIPSQIGNLTNLQILYLSGNQLSGNIPMQLGNLTNLTFLSISHNDLTGNVPTQLENLGLLGSLSLQENQLSGIIPTQLGELSNLTFLSLADNQLSGTIPTQLGNLSNLRTLVLSNNLLSGSIPIELGNLTDLTYLSIADNLLSGCYSVDLFSSPLDMCQFTNENISLGNNFSSDWNDACICGAGMCPCGDVNQWIGNTGLWDNQSSWSLGHVPLPCEKVVISNPNDIVTMPQNYQSEIYTLEVSGSSQFIIPESSELTVLTDSQFVSTDGCN